jgi:Glyoxalase/Bleomycin resistance protein/Dioxygenase superfamily
MSTVFGEIRQLGYVVPDIEAAMEYWTRSLGVGPFFYNPKVPIKNYQYRGQTYEPHNSVALANSGFIQIELIQCRNDVPSMYRDFTNAGKTGLQHVASWTTNYDDDLNRLIQHGFKPVMSGEVGENGRFIYFDTEYHPGTVIELSEVVGPKGDMFRTIREAAATWDGHTDPIRPFPNLSANGIVSV